MKDNIYDMQPTLKGSVYYLFTVELIAENEEEAAAIKAMMNFKATPKQKKLIEDYLLFECGKSHYHMLSVEDMHHDRFYVKGYRINTNKGSSFGL